MWPSPAAQLLSLSVLVVGGSVAFDVKLLSGCVPAAVAPVQALTP